MPPERDRSECARCAKRDRTLFEIIRPKKSSYRGSHSRIRCTLCLPLARGSLRRCSVCLSKIRRAERGGNMTCPSLFPSPLPDETLFSLCARYHLLSASSSPQQTSQILFGNRNDHVSHDFPSGLTALSARTRCLHGNEREILSRLTMWPFFAPFIPLKTATFIEGALFEGNRIPIKFHLGIPPSQIDGTHPLRGCPDCVRSDIKNHELAYWHRIHQLPGVLVCPDHTSTTARASAAAF